MPATALFAIEIWHANPHSGADACLTGAEFETEADARAALAAPESVSEFFGREACNPGVWVRLIGPGIDEVSRNPVAPRRRSLAQIEEAADLAWRREIAMEAGMTFGVDAFNAFMGY